MTRPTIVGGDRPEPPFPIIVSSDISSGFGRGSSELGIPTANIDPDLLDLDTGVYYGWAQLQKSSGPNKEGFNYGSELSQSETQRLPMVMSIGWNPFYNNTKKSAEVHICHKFAHNFYGARIKVAVMGFIRPEQDYNGVDALIADIQFDIKVALNSLSRPEYDVSLQ